MGPVILEDGRLLTIGKTKKEDAAEMLDFLAQVSEETDYMAVDKGVLENTTAEQEEARLEKQAQAGQVDLCVRVEGELAAIGSLAIPAAAGLAHTAELSLAARQEFWGCGVGTMLARELLAQAARLGKELVHLGVRADNERARGLYTRLGFEQAGVLPRFFKADGAYYDEIIMTRPIAEGEFPQQKDGVSQAVQEKLAQWQEDDEYQKIVDAILSVEEEKRGYDLTCQLARALNNLDCYEEGAKQLLSVEEQGRGDHLWLFRLGYAYFYMKEYEKAEQTLRQAVELNGDFSDSWLFLCFALRKLKRTEEFHKAAERLKELSPAEWERYFDVVS